MRFSIRSILLLITFLAIWPSLGAFLAPTILAISFATATVTVFMKSMPRTVSRISFALFIATTSFYLSFGPAAWGMARYIAPDSTAPALVQEFSYRAFQYLYKPIATNCLFAPEPIRQVAFDYVRWWMPRSVVLQDMGKGIG